MDTNALPWREKLHNNVLFGSKIRYPVGFLVSNRTIDRRAETGAKDAGQNLLGYRPLPFTVRSQRQTHAASHGERSEGW